MNSKTRIGACEVCAVFRSQQVPSQLIDFKSNKTNSFDNVITNYFASSFTSSFQRSCEEEICKLVWDYFNSKENSFPIYFQEINHAITIIGCYKESNKIKLLVFDSLYKIQDEADFCVNWKKNFTYEFSKKQKEFQIILIYDNQSNKQELLAKTYSNVLYNNNNKEEEVVECIVID